MYQSESAPWLWFRAWNTDGSAKTDLVFSTSGIDVKVARDNLANSSSLSLSAASSPTDWAAGKLSPIVGNLYRVGISTALISSYTGNIAVCGSYTGGVLEGIIDSVSAYDPTKNPLSPSVAGMQIAISATTGRVTAEAVELDSSSLRSALGMSAADLDAQLDAILAAASAGAGTGARTVTITVNDGTTALQNAVVRLTEGSNTFRALTNASGVATFNLDDATYTVAVTKSGYTYAGTTLVVDGTETATYSMTAVSVTPPTNPDLSAIEVLCLDEDFAAASGIDVDFRMASVAAGDQNRAHPGAKKTVTSNGSGIARFEGPQGATIEWKRGTGQQWTAVTLDSDSVTNVTSLIGSP